MAQELTMPRIKDHLRRRAKRQQYAAIPGPCWNCGVKKENVFGVCGNCGRFGKEKSYFDELIDDL